MALLNHVTREITAKVVYYGPGLCGKTSNLRFIYDNLDDEGRGHMLSLATEADRTLFFDFLPMELGTMRGFKMRVQLYTVPGQVFYEATRKRVLKGCDGVVFVADSQRQMREANRESLTQLSLHLAENGLLFEEVPVVLQYNKRDLPDLLSMEELDSDLNPANAPFFEAVASEGIGVEDTLKAVIRLVLKNLVNKGIIKQEEESGILAEHALPEPEELALPADRAAPLFEDTSPDVIPALSVATASAETADSLFEEAAPELIAASGADPFADLQEMNVGLPSSPNPPEFTPAIFAAPSMPANFDGTTDPEWLFSEPGEETASLLAQVTPLEQAMHAQPYSSDEFLLEPAGSLGLGLAEGIPELYEAPVEVLRAETAAAIPAPVLTIPAAHLEPGQVHSVVLVIDGRTYRLQLQLERMD